MLFNSYGFIFAFLPVTLLGFAVAIWNVPSAAVPWLAVASLIFYAIWNPLYLPLLLGSIAFNYAMSHAIRSAKSARGGVRWAYLLLVSAVAIDLGVLGYFKYSSFFLDLAGSVTGSQFGSGASVLPLGISFFTFTQIAFLVDTWREDDGNPLWWNYLLFVTFFPHLVAGPILHHREIMPQLRWKGMLKADDVAVGLAIFAFGLFKKVMLADTLAPFVTPVFDAAGRGEALGPFEAWSGTVAYALQLYFDFSGYSDMAIGLARLFGVTFPLNFASPYKARSIIEFWRCWHMTLSRFLRDYVYVSLGGNRSGRARWYANLFATMVIGGFWHGAAWSFVVWGAIHGLFLMINHAWRRLKSRWKWSQDIFSGVGGLALTFLSVLMGWVFFRAPNLSAAGRILRGMFGLDGITIPVQLADRLGRGATFLADVGVKFADRGGVSTSSGQLLITALMLSIVWLMPNTQEIFARCAPALDTPSGSRRWWEWQPNAIWAVTLGGITIASLIYLNRVSEFLYYQF